MTKRFFRFSVVLWTALVMAALGTALTSLPSAAQQSTNPQGSQGRQLSLRQQLTVGLRAFTKGDFDFIDKVVAAVDDGRLPRRLVDSTFLWARKRADRKSRSRSLRPMVYFQPALILRARQLRITI